MKPETATSAWQIHAREFPAFGAPREKLQFLLRYAILAPSTRNTQPWRFVTGDDWIEIFVDHSRWQPVADTDERELYLSAGCALENLLIAATRFGYAAEVEYLPDPGDPNLVAIIDLTESAVAPGSAALFDAIPQRLTNHEPFEHRPVSREDMLRIEESWLEEGVSIRLQDDPAVRAAVDDLMVRADALEYADPEFRSELAHWIGQGVFGTSWLISQLGNLATRCLNLGGMTSRRDSVIFMSAPVVGVVASNRNDRRSQIRSGQAFERLFLTATLIGLSVHPMSQALHIAELKKQIAQLLAGPGMFPQQVFRLGYGPAVLGHTPRRKLEEMIAGS